MDSAYDAEEGCPSLLGGHRKCKRYKAIKVLYQTLEMQTRTKNFTGLTAQIIQHEIDLCDGVLISSYTITKMSKGENVTTDTLGKICKVLECNVEDIMEFIPE